MATKELLVYATGRRKESIARVRMKPGSGEFSVNERTLDYGDDGREAVLRLLEMGHKAGIIGPEARVDWVG